MKKYLLLSILLSLPTFFYAQIFPIHEDNPEWSVIDCFSEETITITTRADTFINNNWWIPIERSSNPWDGQKYYRVDGQKVYYRTAESQTGRKEFLMYDFSVEVGDSIYVGIPGTLAVSDTILAEIYVVQDAFVGNQVRRVVVGTYTIIPVEGVSFSTLFEWIEGIGDFKHPFYSAHCLTGGGDIEWVCYGCEVYSCLSTNEGLIYSASEDAPCQFPPSHLSRIYVDKNVESTAKNGSSWQYAFDDLQEAIEIAEDGDTIWVAQGTYYPTSSSNREIFFHLNPGVTIYGGFAATESDLTERDWENNPTILSGDIGLQGDSTDNSYHLVYTIGTDSTAVLDGFTLTRGYAVHPNNGFVSSLISGGGLVVDTSEEFPYASPTIQNCIFELNVGRYGGGIGCYGTYQRYANPAIKNCRFYQNKGLLQGGGVYKVGPILEDKPQRFIDCVFEDNWAAWGGAGVDFDEVCNYIEFENCRFLNNEGLNAGGAVSMESFCHTGGMSMKNCYFENNIGTDGGAMGFYDFGNDIEDEKGFDFYFKDCQMINNTAINNVGGALFLTSWLDTCTLVIDNCIFDGNSSRNGGFALDILVGAGSVFYTDIQNSQFINNYSLNLPFQGALNIEGEAFSSLVTRSFTTIYNTIFHKNEFALSISSGLGTAKTDIQHTTFYDNGNYAIAKNWSESFDYVDFYNLMSLSNCIIWEPDIFLKNMLYNGHPNNQHLYDYTINNCLIPQSACDLPGGEEACNEGMLFAQDPMFVNADNGDLRVGACSPAINAGDNMYSVGINEDIDGNPRILEAITDIGAYERQSFVMNVAGIDSVTCPGDADGAAFFDSNGDLPYTYLWEMGILVDTSATGLAVGEYDFTVTDAAGCEGVLSLNIPGVDTLQVDYTIQHASNIDAQDGALTLNNITGGTAPYTWLWNTEDTVPSLDNLFTGWYILNIIDANNCVSTFNFEVSFPDATNDLPFDEMPIVQPNPVVNGENIHLIFPKNNAENHFIECFSASGLLLKHLPQNKEGNQLTFDSTALAAGLYFIKVSNEMGQFHVFRVVIL